MKKISNNHVLRQKLIYGTMTIIKIKYAAIDNWDDCVEESMDVCIILFQWRTS